MPDVRFGLKTHRHVAFHTPCLLNLRTDHPSVSRMAGVIRWICGKCDALAPGGRRAPGFAGPERIDARRLDGERVAAVHAVRFAATSKADAGERACVSGNARGTRKPMSVQRPTSEHIRSVEGIDVNAKPACFCDLAKNSPAAEGHASASTGNGRAVENDTVAGTPAGA